MDRENLPYELRQLISGRQQRAREGNAADYKCTYQSELDDIMNDAVAKYIRGQTISTGISEEDKQRCRRLYEVKKGDMATYSIDKLVEVRIGGLYVIVPAYISLLDEMRQLKQALA